MMLIYVVRNSGQWFWCYNRKTGVLDIEIVKQINLKAPDLLIESNVKITGDVAMRVALVQPAQSNQTVMY